MPEHLSRADDLCRRYAAQPFDLLRDVARAEIDHELKHRPAGDRAPVGVHFTLAEERKSGGVAAIPAGRGLVGDRAISIDRVLITVKAEGTNKTLGFCDYDPVNVTFVSTRG